MPLIKWEREREREIGKERRKNFAVVVSGFEKKKEEEEEGLEKKRDGAIRQSDK